MIERIIFGGISVSSRKAQTELAFRLKATPVACSDFINYRWEVEATAYSFGRVKHAEDCALHMADVQVTTSQAHTQSL